MEEFPYIECVEELIPCMTGTQPDIAYVVGKAYCSLGNPTYEDCIKVKRILQYLKGATKHNLNYKYTKVHLE